MKRKPVLLSVTILGIFFLTTAGNAQDSYKKFNLKFSGGYGNTAQGDLGEVMDGLNSQLADLAATVGLANPDDVENVNWGFDFEGEFVFSLSKNFGVGLGVGYMERKKDSLAVLELEPLISGSFSWEPKYSAIPINLSGYYYLPISSKMNAFLKAGIGYYSAKITFKTRQELKLLGSPNEWDQNDGEAKDNGFGFHGGLGFEYKITESISLYAEGIGRYANFKNWDVDNTYSDSSGYTLRESGTFWYVEEYEEQTGKYYPSLHLSEQKPSDPGLRNIKKAEIDFSGFSFRIGVKIGLGK